MGVVKLKRPIGIPTASALEDHWQRRATAAAIDAARKIVGAGGVIPPGTPVGRLGDVEWGWVVSAALFSWIQTRAEQATAENIDTEIAIRTANFGDHSPWDAGAIMTILPELAETPGVDWAKPFGEWPRETVIQFLLTAMQLIHRAVVARDLSDRGITRHSSATVIARQTNAAAGGPLMTPDELNDL